jgi:ketosteroid isomerase-like protein
MTGNNDVNDQALAQSQGSVAAVQAEIERLEAKRCAALVAGDLQTLGELLGEDLVHVHGNSVIDDKAAYLQKVADKYLFHSIERGNLHCRVFVDVAIVTGPLKQTISLRGSSERQNLEGSTTQTWVRTGRGWVQNTCHNNFVKTP